MSASLATPRMRPGWLRPTPLWPVAAMAIGLALPPLAALAAEVLAPIVVVMVMGAVLSLPVLRGQGLWLGALGITAALGFAAPMIGGTAALLLGASPQEVGWVALAATAPVGAGAIAAVRMMGLPALATAHAVAASFLAAPFLIPPVAQLTGGASLDTWALAERLWLLAALPAAAGLLLRRVRPFASEAARRDAALASSLALTVLALARVDGVAAAAAADPLGALRLLGLATLPVLAGLAAVMMLLRPGLLAELAIAGGFRNIALVWVAAVPLLPPEGSLFLALTALPVFAVPAVVAALHRRASRR
jgi:hypothetical protein